MSIDVHTLFKPNHEDGDLIFATDGTSNNKIKKTFSAKKKIVTESVNR